MLARAGRSGEGGQYDSYGDECDDDNGSYEEDKEEDSQEEEEPTQAELLLQDKEWIKDNKDLMRIMHAKLEEELESAKSKKVKGTSKKQKEKVGSINYKLTHVKKIKDMLDELGN